MKMIFGKFEKNRKRIRMFCMILLVASLLLMTGCGAPSGGQSETSADQVLEEQNAEQNDAQADLAAEASLVSLRQVMIGTPQTFGAAYFGYAAGDYDEIFAAMKEVAPQLCENLPFLLTVPEGNIAGTEGELFCVVPVDENATVAVNRGVWNDSREAYDYEEVIYRSESGEPILVMCGYDRGISDVQVTITDSEGNVTVWYPEIYNGSIIPLYNDAEECVLYDFSTRENLSGENGSAPDYTKLAGTWELAWTEVEGYEDDSQAGTCKVEITADSNDFLQISYSDSISPEWNYKGRELIVSPGEMYEGCGNDQWIAAVEETSADKISYTLTLLDDDTLLMQNSWEMEGMPMVSYSCYERIS